MLSIGDEVIIQRDEQAYPARGTWCWFRGRRGVIVSINQSRVIERSEVDKNAPPTRGRPRKTPVAAYHSTVEYGVCFTTVKRHPETGKIMGAADAWFQTHEVRPTGGFI